MPTPASVHPVSGVVFYDENANGVIDDGEDVRLPHVVLTLGGSRTESDAEGSFAAAAVPAGTRTVEIRPESLPPQFRAGRVPTVAVPLPEGARVPVPVVLPIGSNRPKYVPGLRRQHHRRRRVARIARGYRSALQSSLRDYWGGARRSSTTASSPPAATTGGTASPGAWPRSVPPTCSSCTGPTTGTCPPATA